MKSAVDWNKNGGRQSGRRYHKGLSSTSDIMRLSPPSPQTEAKRTDASRIRYHAWHGRNGLQLSLTVHLDNRFWQTNWEQYYIFRRGIYKLKLMQLSQRRQERNSCRLWRENRLHMISMGICGKRRLPHYAIMLSLEWTNK